MRTLLLILLLPLEVLGQDYSGYADELRVDYSVLPEANRRILEFCDANLGKKVGNGICGVLAAEAVKASGLELRWSKRTHYPVFGKEVNFKKVLPGDIIEYTNHVSIVYRVEGDYIYLIEQNACYKPKDRKVRIVRDSIEFDLKKKYFRVLRPQNIRGIKKLFTFI
jgi:signal peptidase I